MDYKILSYFPQAFFSSAVCFFPHDMFPYICFCVTAYFLLHPACFYDLSTSFYDLSTSFYDPSTSFYDLSTSFYDLPTSFYDLSTSFYDRSTSFFLSLLLS